MNCLHQTTARFAPRLATSCLRRPSSNKVIQNGCRGSPGQASIPSSSSSSSSRCQFTTLGAAPPRSIMRSCSTSIDWNNSPCRDSIARKSVRAQYAKIFESTRNTATRGLVTKPWRGAIHNTTTNYYYTSKSIFQTKSNTKRTLTDSANATTASATTANKQFKHQSHLPMSIQGNNFLLHKRSSHMLPIINIISNSRLYSQSCYSYSINKDTTIGDTIAANDLKSKTHTSPSPDDSNNNNPQAPLSQLNSQEQSSSEAAPSETQITTQTTTMTTAASESEPATATTATPPPSSSLSYLPPSLHPYARLARLDKPIGTYLLLHPCLWSTALATTPLGGNGDVTTTILTTTPLLENLHLCALFATGAFLMRGAGCTINDMWDANYDKNVQRTKDRPLASGELNYAQAWKFLALQLTGGLGVLLSLPNLEPCFLWGVASLPLVATYPLMKRYTNYPQLVLGMTFNWGAIMGWVAVRGEVDWSVVGPLYASGICWTLVYDTLYAHQDKRDDAKLGLKSTALTFGEEGTKPILIGLTGLVWGGWMMAGYNAGYGMSFLENPYYYGGCSLAASHLLWQIGSADLNDEENLAERFRSNNLVGGLVFGSCVVGNMMAGG